MCYTLAQFNAYLGATDRAERNALTLQLALHIAATRGNNNDIKTFLKDVNRGL